MLLALFEIQIWIRFAVSISFDGNSDTTVCRVGTSAEG